MNALFDVEMPILETTVKVNEISEYNIRLVEKATIRPFIVAMELNVQGSIQGKESYSFEMESDATLFYENFVEQKKMQVSR